MFLALPRRRHIPLAVEALEDRVVPAFSISSPVLTEGGQAVFSIQQVTDGVIPIGPIQPATIRLTLQTRDGSARAGQDYQGIDRLQINWNSADFTTIRQVTVQTFQDARYEGNETFSLVANWPTGIIGAPDAVGTATIQDDDPLPTLAINDVTRSEGTSAGYTAFTFAVSPSNSSAAPMSVRYATADGTATAADDYRTRSGTLSWGPGDKTTRYVTVQVRADARRELNETFQLNLSSPVGAQLSSKTSGIGTILDDGDTVVVAPTVSISGGEIAEGDSGSPTAQFTLQLSSATAVPVTVGVQTADETARAGEDYHAFSGSVVFAPGETVKTVTVTLNPDTRYESAETFNLLLTSASNATLAPTRQAGMTILNDDGVPALNVWGGKANEGSPGQRQQVGWTVGLAYPTDVPVTVTYATRDHTAGAGQDYVSVSGTLTFQPGEQFKSVHVAMIGDTLLESDEIVVLQVGHGAANGPQAAAIIANDDQPLRYDRPTAFDGSNWYLDLNGDGHLGEQTRSYGLPGDRMVVGDWNGDGRDDVGVVRLAANGFLYWYVDSNGDGAWHPSDAVWQYGVRGDVPVVGDWNGDGRDDMGVMRANAATGGQDWIVDSNGDAAWQLSDAVLNYGLLGDTPVTGDWNGDGRTDVGVVRPGANNTLAWHLDSNGDGRWQSSDVVVLLGLRGDVPVVGDWNGDGRDDMGVVRHNSGRGGLDWFIDLDGNGGSEELLLWYGLPGHQVAAGRW